MTVARDRAVAVMMKGNIMLTAGQISSVSVPLLVRSLVLPMTVLRVPGGEYAGSNGDTITVRVRQTRSANKQATPGTDVSDNFSSISETPVTVSLAHLYDGVNVTDEELSLELVDFASQVTEPQVAAVATGAEDELAGAMNGVTADDSFAMSASESDTEAKVLAAREALSEGNVPASDRYMAVSPDIATRLLSVDTFVRVDASGSDNALRNAVVGRIYGMTVVESNGLDAGTAVAYHRSGFAFANRVPVVPRGAADSATATQSGIGLRHIFQYSPQTLQDQSVLSTFAGASVVDASRVYKLDTSTT